MKSSPFQLILLVVFGSLLAAGVMIFALTTAIGNRSSIGPVVIWGTLPVGPFNDILKEASDSNNVLASVSYLQKDTATFDTGLTEALARGAGPDLYLMDQGYAVRDAGKTYPIPYTAMSAGQFSNIFVDASEPFLSSQGIVAIPLMVDPLILYWNRDLMGSAGYTVPPQYWDDLPQIAKEVTQRSDDGRILKSAIALGTYENIEDAKDILVALILQGGNKLTEISEDGKLVPALDRQGAGAIGAVPNAIAFYAQFADPSKEEVYTWNGSFESARKSFAAGDVALYIGRASERPLISALNPNLNFSVAPMLQYRGSPQRMDIAHVLGLAIPRVAKKPNDSKTIAALLATTDLSPKIASAYGMSSALKAAVSRQTLNNDKDKPLEVAAANSAKSLEDFLNSQTAMSRYWRDPDPKQTDALFRDMIQDVVSGKDSVAATVSRLNAALKEVIGL